MAKATINPWLCPKCGSHNVGKVGWNDYFCNACDIEYDDIGTIYIIEWDGTRIVENEFSNVV